jgi:hypothetical protein
MEYFIEKVSNETVRLCFYTSAEDAMTAVTITLSEYLSSERAAA